MAENTKTLRLSFHGRIINHLGIQMYQIPAVAKDEMIANSRDAYTEGVVITLPGELGETAEIVVYKDAIGMTLGKFCYMKARTHHASRTASPGSPS